MLTILVAIVPYAWHARQETRRALRAAEARAEARIAALAAWRAALDEQDRQLDAQIAQALQPVDDYFDERIFPHIGDFLDDYSGLFYDTPRFVYKWLADKSGYRGHSTRVQMQVKASLAEHFGFPDQFKAGVQGSIERFNILEQRRDAELRDRAYAILDGAGVSIDRQKLDALFRLSLLAADKMAFESMAHGTALRFGGLMAGKEAAVTALQLSGLVNLVIERAMVAVGTRLGILAAGAGAAGATASAGTATGIGALPGWGIAAAEIGLTVVVDLAAGWVLERKAEAELRGQFGEVRTEIRLQLRRYMTEYAKDLRHQRAALLDRFVAD